jgi:hypothetical protein
MPNRSKGQKGPVDVIAKFATGGGDAFPADDGKDKAAQSLGRRGGQARAKVLDAKRRVEIARKAAKARWKA